MAVKVVREGIAHIKASFSNTHVSVTDQQGNVVAWGTAGGSGFKGARKGTAFAAQLAAEGVAKKVIEKNGMQSVDIRISGAGQGRESAARALASAGLDVTKITDCTPNPHNGCKRKKKRRV
jgi:small subunit ribosomal protein S11